MADEHKKEEGHGDNGSHTLLWIVGFIILAILWYQNGGPAKIDRRGIFISPPPPLGSGDAYGPQPSQVKYVYPTYQQQATSAPIRTY